MQNKKKTKYTLNVDDSRKSNTKNMTKVNKRIIIVGVIVVIAALLILKMYFLDELKDDKKISSGIEKITGDSDNKMCIRDRCYGDTNTLKATLRSYGYINPTFTSAAVSYTHLLQRY